MPIMVTITHVDSVVIKSGNHNQQNSSKHSNDNSSNSVKDNDSNYDIVKI